MTVYVDDLTTYPSSMVSASARRNGTRWCHLFADTVEELHAFGNTLGLRREWFQDHHQSFPHYDLVPTRRARAIELGAQEITTREWIRRQRERAPV